MTEPEPGSADKQFELALTNVLMIGRLLPSTEPADQNLRDALLEVVGFYLTHRATSAHRMRVAKLLDVVMHLRWCRCTVIDIAAARSEAWRWQANGREDVARQLSQWADEAGADHGAASATPAV